MTAPDAVRRQDIYAAVLRAAKACGAIRAHAKVVFMAADGTRLTVEIAARPDEAGKARPKDPGSRAEGLAAANRGAALESPPADPEKALRNLLAVAADIDCHGDLAEIVRESVATIRAWMEDRRNR